MHGFNIFYDIIGGKEVYGNGKKKRDPKTVAIAQAILEQYNPQSAEDVNNALKDIFGPMFEAMLQGEMNHHLGYENNDKGPKKTDNRRNGYGTKKVKTSHGEIDIEVPRDRAELLNPKLSLKGRRMFRKLKRRF